MKCIKFIFILLLSFTSVNVFANGTSAFNQIVFFGDSLSDNGNLYFYDGHTLPVEPYYNGRFSNGPTWAENLAQNFSTNYAMTSQNIAFAGETASYIPSDSYLNFYLAGTLNYHYYPFNLGSKAKTLFVIWVGGNDYLRGNIGDLDKLATETVDSIQESIESLISHGGKYFLIVNMPDLGTSPAIRATGAGSMFTEAATLHNAKLAAAVAMVQSKHSKVDIHVFDVNTLFTDVLTNPAVYNQKYGTHISNVTESCWTGGYTMQAPVTEVTIAAHLQATFDANKLHGLINAAQTIDFKALAHQIAINKDLSAAYSVALSLESGATPCADPDAYVFWDGIHPTKVVHEVLAGEVGEYIKNVFPV